MDEQRLLDWWLPPEGAGEPVSCLATSFTFDTDFFRDDCLGRFIGLRGAVGEEGVGSLAQINEMEERLSDVTACVLVDRDTTVEGRNLRWDVLPVAVESGLLHAKTAVLMWENNARVIIGSANLTPAGYRYQREIAVAFDLDPSTSVPREFWDEYLAALQNIVGMAPEDLTAPGPRGRADHVIEQLAQRIELADPPKRNKNSNVHVIYVKPGESAVSQLKPIFTGVKPRSMRVLSPFWDTEDKGSVDAVRALTGMLAERGEVSAEFFVPLSATATGGLVHAPADLSARVSRSGVKTELLGVPNAGYGSKDEFRRLHAKALMIESDETVLAMVGSSNMTTAGLGLSQAFGHIELNVAFVSGVSGKSTRQLKEIIPAGIPLDPAVSHKPETDPEEEVARTPLPRGFVNAVMSKSDSAWNVLMRLERDFLPSSWEVSVPALGVQLITSDSVSDSADFTIPIGNPKVLPQGLLVRWVDSEGESCSAEWVLNISNPADLPLDERLRAVPIDLIIQALAQRSTNLPALLDRLLDGLSLMSPEDLQEIPSPLDPLKSYDDSRALLKRIAVYGRALDELQRQLSRPVPTLSALGWRLTGLISPTRIAEGWVTQSNEGLLPVEVAHFLFAELLLSMKRVDWSSVAAGLEPDLVSEQIADAFAQWESTYAQLPPLPAGHELTEYVNTVRSGK